ncbi:MAG: C25 family peptidase propeptide domain-containing protein, partial [Candidatus Thermoplasmatota archaeon]
MRFEMRDERRSVTGGAKRALAVVVCFVVGISMIQDMAGQGEVDLNPTAGNAFQEQTKETRVCVDFSGDEHTILTFETGNVIENTMDTEEGTFTLLTIPNMGYTGEIGKPQLPHTSCFVAVPNTHIRIEILSQNCYERDVGRIYPAQELEGDLWEASNNEIVFDDAAYSKNKAYPGDPIKLLDSGKIRAIPFAKIGFYPVQYNPVTGRARVYTMLQVKISWDPHQLLNVEERHKSKYFDPLYENSFVNWQEFEKTHS